MTTNNDEKYMQIALNEAKKGAGFVNPNPMVGAVIVKNGEILSTGYHHAYGRPHAEREAISAVKNREELIGSTLYVTLEPCCHYGKTPPCTEAIIESQIKRVVCAMADPNPLVAGKGIDILRRNGIHVEVGLLENEARRLNRFFITKQLLRRPFVALKVAQTIDGKTASSSGISKWITSESSRIHAHTLRHKYMGILVGINTVLADDPMLNCRIDNFETKNPTRIILDSNLRIPLESTIVKTAKSIETIVFCGNDTLSQKDETQNDGLVSKLTKAGVHVIGIHGDQFGYLDLNECVEILGKPPFNMDSILVEGGSTVHDNFLRYKLADYGYFYIAPKILGGQNALTGIGGQGFPNPNSCPELEIEEIKEIETIDKFETPKKDFFLAGKIVYPLSSERIG